MPRLQHLADVRRGFLAGSEAAAAVGSQAGSRRQRGLDGLAVRTSLSCGRWAAAPRETPLMLSQPRILMAAATVTAPTTLAVLLGGTARSPQIAPECTPRRRDLFGTRPPGLLRRRKQQIRVFSPGPSILSVSL